MPDAILKLAYEVSRVTEEKVGLIDGVMQRTAVLALNARLEAARAGPNGTAFAVVAQEMGVVAADIRLIAQALRDAVDTNIAHLSKVGTEMHFDLRGERLADLAGNAVEIIDRNLYERSCDVRWWATDAAVVDALATPGADSADHATRRLATILRSYTVYLDLWIADRHGRIVASGRPDRYPGLVGSDISTSAWFIGGMAAATGDDFHVCDIARAPLLGDAPVAAYATAIRDDGVRDGAPLGVLGIFFDWAPQAAAIVEAAGFGVEERERSRVMLLAADGGILAASDGRGVLTERYRLETGGRDRGWYRHDDRIVAFTRTPGYETYRGLGWYGCIESPAD